MASDKNAQDKNVLEKIVQDTSVAMEEQKDFQFLIEDVYKVGGLGLIVVGKVKCGEIDTRTKPWLILKRTGQKVQVKTPQFMHRHTIFEENYWVRNGQTTGAGFGIETFLSFRDFVKGDLLQLTTPPLPPKSKPVSPKLPRQGNTPCNPFDP